MYEVVGTLALLTLWLPPMVWLSVWLGRAAYLRAEVSFWQSNPERKDDGESP